MMQVSGHDVMNAISLLVSHRYYPPDFDPAQMPKGKKAKHNEMKVR